MSEDLCWTKLGLKRSNKKRLASSLVTVHPRTLCSAMGGLLRLTRLKAKPKQISSGRRKLVSPYQTLKIRHVPKYLHDGDAAFQVSLAAIAQSRKVRALPQAELGGIQFYYRSIASFRARCTSSCSGSGLGHMQCQCRGFFVISAKVRSKQTLLGTGLRQFCLNK